MSDTQTMEVDGELRQAAASNNLLSAMIGDWAERKGFREDWEMANWIENVLAVELVSLSARLHTPKGRIGDPSYPQGLESHRKMAEHARQVANAMRTNIIGTKLALIHSEISEALESLRDTGFEGHQLGAGNFGEELADAKIRINELSQMIDVAIGDEEVAKVARNEGRPYKHGRQM